MSRRRVPDVVGRLGAFLGASFSASFSAIVGALVLLSTPAGAADPLPIAADVVLSWGGPEAYFTVDLGTLPTRPVLVVEVTPDASHPDMVTEIEVTDYQIPWGHPGAICPAPETSNVSRSGRLEREMYTCQPAGGYPGTTALVIVRAIYFGVAEDPATVAIRMHGATRPPTSTLTQQVSGPQQAVIPASKDTTIYEDAPSTSNGAGESLWAGMETQSLLTGPVRNSLIAFDVASVVPTTATVSEASLALHVTNADPSFIYQRLVVQRVAPDAGGGWSEGSADGPGDEFHGLLSSAGAADWYYRSRPSAPWYGSGGDPVGAPLLDIPFINSPGPLQQSSSILTEAVQDMVTSGNSDDGFVLSAPGATFPFSRRGIQLASRENLVPSQRPTLIVDYSQSVPAASGSIETSALTFINEGQNFRWIYDLDQDDVFETNIGGVCTVVEHPASQHAPLPYTYSYAGNPGYTGVDCCTWRIDSADTGTIGTGQALFFHNLDPSNPAHMPLDTDQDGIRNLCDNCPTTPNGPLLGSCRTGTTIGVACHSNLDCAGSGTCDLSQLDHDGNSVGNACPEPGLAASLIAGLGLLATIGRERRSPNCRASRH